MTDAATHFGLRDPHLWLALALAATYVAVPFTAVRRLPVTPACRRWAPLFFLTCAVNHVALAFGFYDSSWMLLNDTVQLGSFIAFIWCFSRQVSWTMRRRARMRAGERGTGR